MSRVRRALGTGAVFLFLALCVSAALYVPKTVEEWYEEQIFGQTAFADMPCEPYEIRYYDSFEEKLDAIAARKTAGGQTFSLEVRERTKNVSDEELVQSAKEEVLRLYQAGLLPEEIVIHRLSSRTYCELYAITDGGESAGGADRLGNIGLWELEFVTDHGSMQMRMDKEFRKIYSFAAYQEPHEQTDRVRWDDWYIQYRGYGSAAIAQDWAEYWELSDAGEGTDVHCEIAESALFDSSKKGEAEVWIYLQLKSGNTLTLTVSQYGYWEEGWGVYWQFQGL